MLLRASLVPFKMENASFQMANVQTGQTGQPPRGKKHIYIYPKPPSRGGNAAPR